MSKPVVIRKYENRRLYDTSASRYVTLPEIAARIRSGTEVKVVDARTGEDLTRAVLTQVILEDARARKTELPLDFLRQLIVASDRAVRDLVGWYAQSAAQGARSAIPGADGSPFSPLPFLERLIDATRTRETGSGADPSDPLAPGRGEDDLREEVVELKRRVAELERRLAGRPVSRRTATRSQNRM